MSRDRNWINKEWTCPKCGADGHGRAAREDEPLEPLMATHRGQPVDARDNIPREAATEEER